ncbi:MAG: glycosyl hydrolase, partial [Planctomycetota bacterium]
WFGGKYYVDLLAPGVTEKFIEITLDAYRRELGEHFGKRLPGVFTDEPHLTPAGGIHWSQRLPNDFKERWGYDLMDHLPSLVRPLGDYRKVRHNFFQLLLELFIERWAKPCYEFCDKHNLEFTGHYWEHGWPGAGHGGDNMAMYAWHHRPAIDTLMNQYREDTHAQFGNARAVRELSSVANQLGRTRTLCEAYGAGGWDLRFEDMKRIGDWLYVLGVNTLNEHLSYITIRGARKRDHPQSFSYHTPWWKAYHVMAGYFTRLSLVLSQGEQINQVLLIEPTTTTWMYQPDSSQRARLGDIGNQFQDMVLSLERAQVEYDIGCEDIIARHGSIEAAMLEVGKRKYDTVVLPPLTENLNAKVMDLLETYLKTGGAVICCGPPPARVDGRLSERGQKVSKSSGWSRLEPAVVPRKLLNRPAKGFTILRGEDDKGILFHHRRQMEDGEFLFLVNTSITAPSSGTIESNLQGLEQWDLQTGKISKYSFKKTDNGINAEFKLPPCGSLLLFLTKKSRNPAPTKAEIATEIPAKGPPKARRLEHNVLTLDYVDVTAGGETKKNIYFYRANRFAFQQNGMDRNPWDSAVQFRDELIKKKFPADSGFSATYRFTIEKQVPNELYIVIERPDLYSINCNGKAVKAIKGSWWLDKSFGKVNIKAAAKVGDNTVTIKASPFTIYHELEPAYVLGDFALKAADSGFVIVSDRPLGLDHRRDTHGTNPDGSMWLSNGIGFSSDVKNDGDPFIIFDLGSVVDLRTIKIWNYNEVNLTGRGAKQVQIIGSATGKDGSFTISLGKFNIEKATSGSASPETLNIGAKGVRFVKFDILSNHNGVTFPTSDGSNDNAFVGLSEVRFFGIPPSTTKSKQIPTVAIHDVSSELTRNFNRRATFLIDDSGLSINGWNQQGYPFYAAGVSYTQTFKVTKPKGKYQVQLPHWYGSVAEVIVNGKPAGYIAYQPWQCDVTPLVKRGTNEIEIVVIGTLKNTLGPHHAGQTLGAAWPNMFHRGPEKGPPPGNQYHTVGYGLFKPFVLKNMIKQAL